MKISTRFSLAAACGLLAIPAVQAGTWAHYSFDSDFTDSSGNGRDGTLTDVGTAGNSGITTTAGEFKFGGGAMNFSAERDYIAIPSKTFSSGIAYTISFWARKTDPVQVWDMVIGQRDNSIFFIALNEGDFLRWRSNNAASGIREADFAATDDTSWHHYAITVDNSKNLSFYLDGAFQTTVSNVETGFIIDTIGEAYTSSANLDFHGQIDEMWVFDEALDATAVSNLHTFNTTIPEPSATALLGLAGLALALRRRNRQ